MRLVALAVHQVIDAVLQTTPEWLYEDGDEPDDEDGDNNITADARLEQCAQSANQQPVSADDYRGQGTVK